MTTAYRYPVRRALSLAALCLVMVACAPMQDSRKSLQEGFVKYSARQIDESEAIATAFITENPTSPNLDEAFYLRGLSRMTRGNRISAADDLRQAMQKTTRVDLRAKAARALGDIEFESQHWPEAQQEYAKALDAGAGTQANVTYMCFRIGASLQAQGQWKEAQSWFQRAVAAKGEANLTDRAIARMYATSFSLQYGAFHEAANSTELANQLKSAGITPVIATEMPLNDRGERQLLYLVRSGTYQTWQEAAVARDKMISKYPLVAIVP